MTPSSQLPPGTHTYESIVKDISQGKYRFARIRSAAGRLNYFIGISPEQLALMNSEAQRRGLGLIALGSRVSGPRVRQRELHAALSHALQLQSTLRSPSPTYPGARGIVIDKTAIKEFGPQDARSSDISLFLIDPRGRDEKELHDLAVELEYRFRAMGCSFPIKVFPSFEGRVFRGEKDFLDFGRAYLRRRLQDAPPFSDVELGQAFKELYMTIGMSSAPFRVDDLWTGALNALLAGISFSIALKFHPIVLLVGFLFGLTGRHLARFKAWIASGASESFLSNSLALLADAVIGASAMALLINPLAGMGIPLERILWASVLHTLSKGTVRLYFDKRYWGQPHQGQQRGVRLSALVSFLQGLTTSYIYAGSLLAVALQTAVSIFGLTLVYRAPLASALNSLKKPLEGISPLLRRVYSSVMM